MCDSGAKTGRTGRTDLAEGVCSTTHAGRVLQDLVADTARRLERLAEDMSLRRVNERDHLAKCFRDALADGLPRTGYRPARPGERRCDFPRHFPRVGNVDALLVPASGPPVWVELKCGSSPTRALAACGWDSVKCAVGLAQAATNEAYLLAGAPADLWGRGILGTELFRARTWSAEDLRFTFRDAFIEYEELGDPQPLIVPDAFTTTPVGPPASFAVADTHWQLRLARVSVDSRSREWRWPPFLTPTPHSATPVRRRPRTPPPGVES